MVKDIKQNARQLEIVLEHRLMYGRHELDSIIENMENLARETISLERYDFEYNIIYRDVNDNYDNSILIELNETLEIELFYLETNQGLYYITEVDVR